LFINAVHQQVAVVPRLKSLTDKFGMFK
jgi:hypothetical protein